MNETPTGSDIVLGPADAIRVIIVDDHEMFMEAITHVLARQADIEVVGGATTAADGVSLAGAMQPDVAIVDYQLPDGDGASVTQAIRKVCPRTRVLILSGSSSEQHLIDAIDAGCSGFVTKDKAADTLVGAVRLLYSGEPYIQPTLVAHLLPRVKRSYERLGDGLTPRELEVLTLLSEGITNKAIATKLFVSVHTVRNHVQNVLEKLAAHSKLEAVAIATREGILERSAS